MVWEWWFFDHVVQDLDPAKPNYVGRARPSPTNPGRININLPGRPLKRDWLHCNSMDYNAELDQIVINSVQGEFYVIDHDGTFVAGEPAASIAKAAGPAGDFLYRFGDPARYEQGDPPRILENWTRPPPATSRSAARTTCTGSPPACPARGTSWSSTTASICSSARRSRRPGNQPVPRRQRERHRQVRQSARCRLHYARLAGGTDKTPKQISKQIVWSYIESNDASATSAPAPSGCPTATRSSAPTPRATSSK